MMQYKALVFTLFYERMGEEKNNIIFVSWYASLVTNIKLQNILLLGF